MRIRRALTPSVCLLIIVAACGCSRTPQQQYAHFLSTAKKQLAGHEYARAALNLQNAAKAQPKEVEPYYLLGQAYLAMHQLREAIVSLRKATEVNPGYAPAQLKLAELMIMTHNDQLLKDAQSRVQAVLTRDPSDNDALFTLAAAQVGLGRQEDAEKYLMQVLEKSPSHLRSSIALAQLKIANKDFAGAEAVLKKALDQAPNSSDAAAALGALYAGAGRTADALVLFKKAVQLDGNNAPALMGLAALQLKAGNIADGEATYKQIAALPQRQHTLAYAVFLMQQNRREDAVAELERVVKADPSDRVARSGLAAGYLAANRIKDAESVLNEALKKNPRDIDALIQRSQIYLQQNKDVDAERDLDAVLRSDPALAQAHYLKAKIHRARGAVLLEKQELAEALRTAPESLRVRLDLANALLLSNNPKAALLTLDGAPESQKRTLAYVAARNWLMMTLGDVSAARQGVDVALKAAKIPDVILQDGILKLANGNFAGARVELEQLLQHDPEDLRALATLVQTYVAQKQVAAATERIRRSVAERPKSARLQMFWADWLLQNEKTAEARQALGASIAADGANPAPRLMLARLDFSEHKLDDARRTLAGLLAIDPRNAAAHMLLGMVEEASKNYPGAIDQYKKAIDAESTNALAMNNLAYLLSSDSAQLDAALAYAQKAKELAPEDSRVLDTLVWIYYRKHLYPLAARELELALAKAPRPTIKYHLGVTYMRLSDSERGRRLIAAAIAAQPELEGSEMQP